MKKFIQSVKALFTIPDDWYRYYEGQGLGKRLKYKSLLIN